jgi:Delta3-Delta2-enoyl-CoA isomerase
MIMSKLTQPDGIYVLQLGDDENRFTLEWIEHMHTHLDEIVGSPAPLVTTAQGKFYSNGLDLEWVPSNSDQLPGYVARVQELLAPVLTLPVPTAAAISGLADPLVAEGWPTISATRACGSCFAPRASPFSA